MSELSSEEVKELREAFKGMMSNMNERMDEFKSILEIQTQLLKGTHEQAYEFLTPELREEFKKTNMRLNRWITGCGLADLRFARIEHE